MNKSYRILSLFLLAWIASAAMAQDKKDIFNPVNHAVTSQMIAPDARAAGMGDVGAATDPDVNSQYWNPAKYPFTISRAGISLNYALAATVGERYGLGLSFGLLPYWRLQRRIRVLALLLFG